MPDDAPDRERTRTRFGGAVDADWFTRSFAALYPVLYAHRSVDAARPEAEFAAAQLSIVPTDRVLDLCCGSGRHMIHLLRYTPHVIGLDFSPHMIEDARQCLGAQAHLVRGDMRAIPFVDRFDVALNFFTSFGYFMDDADNRSVIEGMALSLRRNGRFFIDFVNSDHAQSTILPSSERTVEGYHVQERRWIDEALGRLNKRTTVSIDGEVVHEFDESVRLYSADDLRAMLDQNGLAVREAFGDYDGQPVSNERPRLILVGEKAGS